MRVVRLQGGLGNQIFQYAVCKRLERRGHKVLLDTRHLQRCRPPRNFSLGEVFSDAASYVLPEGTEIDAGFWTRWVGRNVLSSRLVSMLGSSEFLVEREGWSLVDLDGPAKYYVGYWQSEDLVQAVEPELRKRLLHLSAQEVLSFGVGEVRDDDVALHIRRGDYVSNARAAEHHGVLPLGYYRDALNLCMDRGCKRAVIFSDDVNWCRGALAGNSLETVFASSSGARADVVEFKLMLEFRNHVIANSTFSWWAARLAREKGGGFTIAPRQWFVNSGSSFLPDSWEKL